MKNNTTTEKLRALGLTAKQIKTVNNISNYCGFTFKRVTMVQFLEIEGAQYLRLMDRDFGDLLEIKVTDIMK